jgi:hypothetical protein
VTGVLDILLSEHGHSARIALVTGHVAVATGQMRWFSNFGGFSVAWALNEAFARAKNTDFFFLAGTENPADAISRDTTTTSTRVKSFTCQVRLPSLARALHPYRVDDRPIHCV